MRHVPRTHRVDLDWLFERLREDPGISIRHVGTKNQIADMLTAIAGGDSERVFQQANMMHVADTVVCKMASLTKTVRSVFDPGGNQSGRIDIANGVSSNVGMLLESVYSAIDQLTTGGHLKGQAVTVMQRLAGGDSLLNQA